MSKLKILLTGGTGFLGQQVLPLLREVAEVDVISRSGKSEVQGDLTRWNAGLDLEALRKRKYDIFIHMAGLYELTASHADCFIQNVAATGTALKVARELSIPVFMNTSSVAAGVNSPLPTVKPFDICFTRPFPDPYAESKALAEQLIINRSEDFRLCINLRLGVLVGDTKTGKIHRIDGPYHSPCALEKIKALIEKFPTAFPLPGKYRQRLPIVPVDKAAAALVQFAKWSQNEENKGYQSFHITPKEGLSVQELYSKTLKHLFIPHKGVALIGKVPKTVLTKVSSWTVRFPEEELNYLLNFPKYDSIRTLEVLGPSWCPEFGEYEKAFWRGYDAYISDR
jgi:nucleoside-diphosphate-sugar epimerase